MSVFSSVAEPLVIHENMRGGALRRKVAELLEIVGLNPYFVNRFPHEFSGGQRQRISIARALSSGPEFLVCDEPTSALDPGTEESINRTIERVGRDVERKLGWDDRLIGATLPNGTEVRYRYDALGRRVERDLDLFAGAIVAGPHRPFPTPDPCDERFDELTEALTT